MPLQKRPVNGLDDVNQKRRDREVMNQILDHSFDDSRVQTSAEKLAGVTPVNYAYSPEILNLKRFMTRAQAAGDGTKDIGDAIEKASSVMPANVGGMIYVPPGNWRLEREITFKPKTIIYGEGWASNIQFYAQANGDIAFRNASATAGPDGFIEFKDLSLVHSNPSSFHSVIGIQLIDNSGVGSEHSAYCKIRGIKFQNWNWRAINMDWAYATYIDQCNFWSIKNYKYATSAGAAVAMYMQGVANGVSVIRNHTSLCDQIMRVGGIGTSAALSVINNTFEASSGVDPDGSYANPAIGDQFHLQRLAAFSFKENYCEALATGPSGGPGTDATLRLDDCHQGTISSNYFQGEDPVTTNDVVYRHIRVEGDCEAVVIEQNDFEGASNRHVAVEAGAEDTVIRNNRYVFGGSRETTMAAVRSHIEGDCVLENNEYSQTVSYTASAAVNTRAGKHVAVAALTGNVSLTTTNNPTMPGVPREMVLELVQDGTGGRTVTFSTGFAANSYTNTGNTAGKNWRGVFHFDNSAWQLISHTGWY